MYNNIGGVAASLILTDTNGKIYVHADGVSYYVDTPTATISSTSQTRSNVINNGLIYGSVENGSDIPGIVFNATVTPPTYNGSGTAAFAETVIAQKNRFSTEPFFRPHQEISSHGVPVLVTSFPYTPTSQSPAPTWSISSALVPISTSARPGIALERPEDYDLYASNSVYVMYVMYKPNGSGSIWVPIAQRNWSWIASASWNPNLQRWETYSEGYSDNTGTSTPETSLPQWSKNTGSLDVESWQDINPIIW